MGTSTKGVLTNRARRFGGFPSKGVFALAVVKTVSSLVTVNGAVSSEPAKTGGSSRMLPSQITGAGRGVVAGPWKAPPSKQPGSARPQAVMRPGAAIRSGTRLRSQIEGTTE